MRTTNVKISDLERIAKANALMRAAEIILIGNGPQETIVGRNLDKDGDIASYVTWVSQPRLEDLQQFCNRNSLIYYINPVSRQSAREKCPTIVGEGLILEIIFIVEYKM